MGAARGGAPRAPRSNTGPEWGSSASSAGPLRSASAACRRVRGASCWTERDRPATWSYAPGGAGPLVSWLADLGVEVTEEVADTHIVHWRAGTGGRSARRPTSRRGSAATSATSRYLAVPCDGSTFSVTLAVRSSDREAAQRAHGALGLRPGRARCCRGRTVSCQCRPRGAARPGPPNGWAHQPAAPPATPDVSQRWSPGSMQVGGCAHLHEPDVRTGLRVGLCPGHLVGSGLCGPRRRHNGCAIGRVRGGLGARGRAVVPHLRCSMDSMGDSDGVRRGSPTPWPGASGRWSPTSCSAGRADPVVAQGLLRMINSPGAARRGSWPMRISWAGYPRISPGRGRHHPSSTRCGWGGATCARSRP